ncbi:hypothetical protein M426DRAFT_321096 [Hypoxylon sp. CI-4A]|nr:hypothetical protein M426DRAFT_321096 [Hypoxylon sp. CI-4A]
MDMILNPRIPKGGKGGGGGGGKGGNYGSGGGGNGHNTLPLWAELVIIFAAMWVGVFLVLFFRFLRQDVVAKSSTKRASASMCGSAAWKAFKYLTLIQLVIWLVRKISDCCTAARGTKKVGDSFYRKVAAEERGERAGAKAST